MNAQFGHDLAAREQDRLMPVLGRPSHARRLGASFEEMTWRVRVVSIMRTSIPQGQEMSDYPTKEFDSEIVIGLVGAVGTEIDPIVKLLRERFQLAGYVSHVIKISSDIIPRPLPPEPVGTQHYRRISCLMDAGNQARESASKVAGQLNLVGDREDTAKEADRLGNAILATGAASAIFEMRPNTGAQDVERNLPKTVFIIDSLKRPEEVELLRMTYSDGFVLIGVHAELDRRRRHLINDLGITEKEADDLLKRDGEEAQVKYGQRLNKTFHLADFFVSATASSDRLRGDIQRVVEVLFGNPFVTPTFDEYAMFMAYAAGLRSADLSRQVGAVITHGKEILSTGANDCPRAGGGLYWQERGEGPEPYRDEPEGRDHVRKKDPNRTEQIEIIHTIIEEVRKHNHLSAHADEFKDLLDKSRIRDLTEFGRVVHAEMEALLACGRNGISTKDATLFCTTFPCHNCAKHLVAAGVMRVVYVEPYPKSKALEFHTDSIVTTPTDNETGRNRVRFEPFVGIGARRFFDLFSMQLSSGYDLERKDSSTGQSLTWNIESARLRTQMNPQSYLVLEAQCRTQIEQIQGGNP